MDPCHSGSLLAFPHDLNDFTFERVLDENPNFHSLIVLGTFPAPLSTAQPSDRNSVDRFGTQTDSCGESTDGIRLPAILRIERTAFSSTFTDHLSTGIVTSTKRIGDTDIYSWWHGWLARKDDIPDVKITVIFPATEVHIRKYTKQERIMVTETPDLYHEVVEPYIDAFPASRTQWVRDVLEGKSETGSVLCRTSRFLILPDMKWDPSWTDLVALPPRHHGHVGMLEEISDRAYSIAKERWALPRGALRMYIHYQPSYYHFHVHIVHASQDGTMGMAVGQAHLLEDIISMNSSYNAEQLRHSPNILSELTLTYGLGSQHGLYDAMVAAQVGTEEYASTIAQAEQILRAFV
ncbi:HIT-like domain-containing protein [Butyriboletus roseoflavus]|nr:HIT-like domain-containing protein [Butyriboletus roseoflavus]